MIERRAARAILLTPEQQTLLLRVRPPDGSACFWITPGGGVKPGETLEAGLRRELAEELGLTDVPIGPLVWRRQHTFDWGEKRIRQREEYYVVRVDHFEPRMSDALEMQVIDRFQWWPIAHLAGASERLTPLSLAQIVERFLADGPPDPMPETEVIFDPPVFGRAPAEVVCVRRPAAYVVVFGAGGRVATVHAAPREAGGYWLPGGALQAGEAAEDAAVREVREELGYGVRLTGRIGDATQFFYAQDDARWYEMAATFFVGDLEAEASGPAEHELCWLDPVRQPELFFHACHAWAAAQAPA